MSEDEGSDMVGIMRMKMAFMERNGLLEGMRCLRSLIGSKISAGNLSVCYRYNWSEAQIYVGN
jgi:hypothetical protein